MSITAMKQALEALERYSGVDQRACDAEDALRQAIEQAEKQEPVAWMYDRAKYRESDLRGRQWAFKCFSQTKPYMDEMVRNVTPLYTTPQQELLLEPEGRCKECLTYNGHHDGCSQATPLKTKWVNVECPLCGDMAVAETHPVLNKREWVGLTDEEVIGLMRQFPDHLTRDVARAIEQALKERNT